MSRGFLVMCALGFSCAPALQGYVLSDYGESTMRHGPHAGVDFEAPLGSPVLAAADGEVTSVSTSREIGCGRGVLLYHPEFGRYTVYCHLGVVHVTSGERVTRGQVIAEVGLGPGRVPHVHLEICRVACPFGHADGDLAETIDPLIFLKGCFADGAAYPTEELELTYPVRCTVADKKRRPDPPTAWMERELVAADRAERRGDYHAMLVGYEKVIDTQPLLAPDFVFEEVALRRFRQLVELRYSSEVLPCEALALSDRVLLRLRTRGTRIDGALLYAAFWIRLGDAARARAWLELYFGPGPREHVYSPWMQCLESLRDRTDTLTCAEDGVALAPAACDVP